MRKFFYLAAMLLAFACAEKPEQDPILRPDPSDDYDASITFASGTKVSIKGEGASEIMRFSCDHEWYVVPDSEYDWLSFDRQHGSAGKACKVVFTAKENGYEAREAKFHLMSGKASVKFSVKQSGKVLVLRQEDIEDFDKYIKPEEFSGFDMLRSDSKWAWCRSRQSEHFVVFWSKDYGEYGLWGHTVGVDDTWPTTCKSSSMQVDIDDLLEKAEKYYELNVVKLGFAELGKGKSVLDKHKIEIYLHYTSEWMAYGSGYDNKIGALWINPATCKPVGSTIAHEIGHSFQFQVYCDALANGEKNDFSTAFRYDIGKGNGFWEACANWQAFQLYAQEAFDSYNFTVFQQMHHSHITHEYYRYASYFILWYMVEKRGIDEVGRIWRESRKPEDLLQVYMRIHELTLEQLWEELYMYAAKCATWDFQFEVTHLDSGKLTGTTATVAEFGKSRIGALKGVYRKDGDGYWWPGKYEFEGRKNESFAPEATGFNLIELSVPEAGTVVSADFVGQAGAEGHNPNNMTDKAGWNVGYVALLKDGSRAYAPCARILDEGKVEYIVPEDCSRLWFVVLAAPTQYMQHIWDEDNTNDVLWPYKVAFTNTDKK